MMVQSVSEVQDLTQTTFACCGIASIMAASFAAKVRATGSVQHLTATI